MSIVGTFLVRVKEGGDPQKALNKGEFSWSNTVPSIQLCALIKRGATYNINIIILINFIENYIKVNIKYTQLSIWLIIEDNYHSK